MKKIIFLLVTLILSACTSQVTVTSQMTVTLPAPTETPIPTPTLSPQFNSLQQQIARSKDYTLNANGTIEMQTPEGVIIVPDIKVSKDGEITITQDGEVIDVDEETFKIEEDKITLEEIITTKDEQGRTWVWDRKTLSEEIREFTPANTIEFTENLTNYDLALAPDADKKAIYNDALVNNLIFAISPSLLENRAVLEKVLEENPEWQDIGPGSDYNERLAFMKAFLEASGGRMTIQNHIFEKFEVDFNLPVKFEVIKVDKLPTGYSQYLARITNSSAGGGGSIYVNENSQLIYSVAIAPEGIESTQVEKNYGGFSFYYLGKWTPGEVISDIFRKIIAQTAYRDIDSDRHKYQLYTKGGDPSSSSFFSDVYWTFIKSK